MVFRAILIAVVVTFLAELAPVAGSFVQPTPAAPEAMFAPGLLDLGAGALVMPQIAFTPGPPMTSPRMGHSAASLPDGRLIAFGGHTTGFVLVGTADLWNKSPNTFSSLTMKYTHDGGAIAELPSGRILLAGGFSSNLGVGYHNNAEIYNPADNSFTAAANKLTSTRAYATAAPLSSGKVLIVGAWYNNSTAARKGDLFDPATGTFSAVGALNTARALPLVFPTPSGGAVIIGGYEPYGTSQVEQVEEYVPGTGSFSVLQSALIPGESGWKTWSWESRLVSAQQLTDGRYLYMAQRVVGGTTQYMLFTFNPTTKQIAKLNTTPALPQPVGPPVVDRTHGKAYLLTVASNPSAWQLTTVDLATGALSTDPTSYTPGFSSYGSVLALLADQRLFLTGGTTGNNFGALANTLLISAPSPTTRKVYLPLVFKSFRAGIAGTVAAGWFHTCAITASGGAKCWGQNTWGQLGDGTNTDRLTPVNVSGLTNGVKAISAGGNHTCALMLDGSVRCWGHNNNGELGDGTTTDRNSPVAVNGLTGAVAIEAGSHHTCGLTSGGGLKCWGSNSFGSIGDGTNTDRLTPAAVTGMNSGVRQVSLGAMHTCAVTEGGGAKCWGWNSTGEVGDGTITDRNAPVDVSGLTGGVSSVGTGEYHTCAVMATGSARCWGSNASGELGDGTTTQRRIPVDVSGLSGPVAAIEGGGAGIGYSCALTAAGGVKCWGWGALSPLDIPGLNSGVSQLAAGSNHTCVRMSGGGIKCWGANGSGQLGDGTTTNRGIPVDVIGFP